VNRVAGLLVATLLVAGCAGRRADRLFVAGDYPAAITAYEAMFAGRAARSAGDARRLMNLALAYSDPQSPSYDAMRTAEVLNRLTASFPGSARAREAKFMLVAAAASRRATELEIELARRDEQLARLRAVLDSLAQAEQRLRVEAESKDEAALDLAGRVNALTGKARALTEEIAALKAELDAIKRIDLESATRGADPP
jgi:hypothetical protein